MAEVRQQGTPIEELDWVIDNTALGNLEWGHAAGVAVIGSNTWRVKGRDWQSQEGIEDIRVGYHPYKNSGYPRIPWSLNYITIKYAAGKPLDIDPQRYERDNAVIRRAERVLYVACLAVHIEGGRLPGATKHYCQSCEAETPVIRLVERPHGIEGAVMPGSEHCECARCGDVVSDMATTTVRE
ncbi:hypothetical protein KC878_03275 [Candidatus Saccharibacteria bacterium]|nr:hypothetical protein [Candidatus Saccharibacteria bacterium]MCB9821638.1 hypothetical protein [Candidatus Nomurabacteria bacterium]